MNANWIEETTTTTGTGTLTLAGAITGRVAFNDAFPDAAVVRYIIEASNGDFESGIGTFTASGTTLSRDAILETWIESTGTLDNSNPSALTLPSGTHSILSSPDANFSAPTPLGLGVADRVMSSHLDYFVGSTGQALAADTQIAQPFKLEYPVLVSSLGMALTTGIDGSTSRLGWSRMVEGLPIDMIFDVAVATTTTQSSTFTSASVTAQLIRPGWYFFHILSDSAISPTSGVGNDAAVGWSPLKKINAAIRPGPSAQYTKTGVTGGVFDAPETVTGVSTGRTIYALCLVE